MIGAQGKQLLWISITATPGTALIVTFTLSVFNVAIDMLMYASNRFPELQLSTLSVVITTTIIFEMFGPLATSDALRKC